MGVRGLVTAGLALLVTSAVVASSGTSVSAGRQKATKDGVYVKEQADRATEQFARLCAHCHVPEKVPEGKKPGPPLAGDVWYDAWKDRTLGELMTTIRLTMPNDGSATLTPDEAVDLTAYILQWNKFPEGKEPLKNDDVGKKIVITK